MPDSDDAIQRDYLKIMHGYTKKSDVDVVICDINNVTDETIFQESERTQEYAEKDGKEFFKDFIMHKISIGPVSLMINNQLLEKRKIRFNENSKYSEEFIFINEVLYNAKKCIHVKEKLYNYCLRSGSVSTDADINKIMNGYKEICKYSKRYENNENEYQKIYNKYALPRWILATARFNARNLEYREYRKLMKMLDAKKEIKKLLNFPSIKIKMASITYMISERIFYYIMR